VAAIDCIPEKQLSGNTESLHASAAVSPTRQYRSLRPRRPVVYLDLQDYQGAFASLAARPPTPTWPVALVARQNLVPDSSPP
jgi:hypothetical protein